MTLYLHLENPTPERYLQLMRFTATPETEEIVTFFHFSVGTTATKLGLLDAAQEEFSREKPVKFRLFATFSKGQLFLPALLRRLRQISCTVIHRRPCAGLDKRLRKAGISTGYRLPPPRYTRETAAGFAAWLRDPKATPEPAYMNLLSALALQIPSPDCRRSSCLTRYYYLDRQDTLYLCPFERSDRTRLGQLGQGESALALFAGEAPIRLLEGTVQRREACGSCSGFRHCQGGCPLETTDCEAYRDTVTAMEETLRTLPDLQGLNPHATRLLLHAVACGKGRDLLHL